MSDWSINVYACVSVFHMKEWHVYSENKLFPVCMVIQGNKYYAKRFSHAVFFFFFFLALCEYHFKHRITLNGKGNVNKYGIMINFSNMNF